MKDYHGIDTEDKRTIMRDHAFLGRIISIIALLITYVDSGIYIVGYMVVSGQEKVESMYPFGAINWDMLFRQRVSLHIFISQQACMW